VTKIILEYMPNIEIDDNLKVLKHLKKEIIDEYREEIINLF
jgi:hypothetical protein